MNMKWVYHRLDIYVCPYGNGQFYGKNTNCETS